MRVEENMCVGCPTYCINCGRKHAIVIVCDRCGDEIWEEENHEVDDLDICPDCYEKYYKDEEEEDE